MTQLFTDRLILTPVAAEDFDDIHRLWQEPGFHRAIGIDKPLSAEDVWARVLRDIGHWSVMTYGNWSLRLKAGGDYVGPVGILNYRRNIDPPFDAPELGWGVATRYQGQGLAREALDAVLAHADSTLGLERTVCMISPDNADSLKLADRVGFRPYSQASHRGDPVILLSRILYAGH